MFWNRKEWTVTADWWYSTVNCKGSSTRKQNLIEKHSLTNLLTRLRFDSNRTTFDLHIVPSSLSLVGRKNSAPGPVKKLDRSARSSVSEIFSRWQEHFESALNFPPAPPCPELSDLAAATPPSPLFDTNPPSIVEVQAAIKKHKTGRAAGLDSITSEISDRSHLQWLLSTLLKGMANGPGTSGLEGWCHHSTVQGKGLQDGLR